MRPDPLRQRLRELVLDRQNQLQEERLWLQGQVIAPTQLHAAQVAIDREIDLLDKIDQLIQDTSYDV